MKGIIDRIEEGIAVIQLKEGREFLFAADQLPQGSKEGSVIEVVIRLDKEVTKEREEIIRERQERLKQGSQSPPG